MRREWGLFYRSAGKYLSCLARTIFDRAWLSSARSSAQTLIFSPSWKKLLLGNLLEYIRSLLLLITTIKKEFLYISDTELLAKHLVPDTPEYTFYARSSSFPEELRYNHKPLQRCYRDEYFEGRTQKKHRGMADYNKKARYL